MSAPQEPANVPREHPLLWGIKTGTEYAAVFAGFIYVTGFIIVSFAQARLGVTSFSLLRPKILAAGLGFAFSASIGILLAARWFQLFGLYHKPSERLFTWGEWDKNRAQYGQRHKAASQALNAVLFLAAAYGLTFIFGLAVFSQHVFDPGPALVAFIFLAMRWLARPFLWWPATIVMLITVVVVGVYVWGATIRSEMFWVAVWFVAVAVALQHVREMSDPETLRTTRWEDRFPILVGLLVFYGAMIYPRMKPEYGGGRPTHVVVHFVEARPVFGNTDQINANLIDENEHGYYLQPTTGKAVFFVPREAVVTVRFER